jgi:hypothetical protein
MKYPTLKPKAGVPIADGRCGSTLRISVFAGVVKAMVTETDRSVDSPNPPELLRLPLQLITWQPGNARHKLSACTCTSLYVLYVCKATSFGALINSKSTFV